MQRLSDLGPVRSLSLANEHCVQIKFLLIYFRQSSSSPQPRRRRHVSGSLPALLVSRLQMSLPVHTVPHLHRQEVGQVWCEVIRPSIGLESSVCNKPKLSPCTRLRDLQQGVLKRGAPSDDLPPPSSYLRYFVAELVHERLLTGRRLHRALPC